MRVTGMPISSGQPMSNSLQIVGAGPDNTASSIESEQTEGKGFLVTVKDKCFGFIVGVKDLICCVTRFLLCGCFCKVDRLSELKEEKTAFEVLQAFLVSSNDKEAWKEKFNSLPLHRQEAIMREDFYGMAISKDENFSPEEIEDFVAKKMSLEEEREKSLIFVRDLQDDEVGGKIYSAKALVQGYLSQIITGLTEEINQIEAE